MKILLKIELKRAFCSIWFAVAILLCMGIVGYNMFIEVIPRYSYLDFYIKTTQIDYQVPGVYNELMMTNQWAANSLFFFVMPLVISLPYSATIYNDIKNKYSYNIVTRIDSNKYYLSKLLAQFIVGFALVMITFIMDFVSVIIFFPFEMPMRSSMKYLFVYTNIFGRMFYKHPFITDVIIALLISAAFALIGCLSFTFAYILDNVIMAMCSPFLLYFIEHAVSSLLYPGKSLLNTIRLNAVTDSYLMIMLLHILIVLVLVVLSYYARVKVKDNI